MGILKSLLRVDDVRPVDDTDLDPPSPFASAEAAIDRAVAALQATAEVGAQAPSNDRRSPDLVDRRAENETAGPLADERRIGPKDRRLGAPQFGRRRFTT